MKNVILIVSLLVSCITVFGQEQRTYFGDVYFVPGKYKSIYNSPEGSPYLNEEFVPAKINNIADTQLVRFDAVLGNVEVMITESKVVTIENSKPYTISLMDGSNKVYKTLKYADLNGNENNSFFELLDSTLIYKLYLKENKRFFKKVKAQGYAEEKPAQFKKVKSEFYVTDFKSQSERLLYIPQKLKPFTEFFQEDSKSIKNFIKDNKLNIGDANDLVKIFKFHFEQ
ncbi:MAG: hypothetical protein WBN20_09725 [Eudoraea sp.]|uniref:hypothetical protein n=2 Tax=Eudoraea sp. TaxID=1979955 RepID=UPI003C70F1E2